MNGPSNISRPLIALAVIAIAVYLGFSPLFELVPSGVPQAVVSSSFGAIFVIILTMYLLNKQSEVSFQLKKGERVFDEKVKLYQSVIESVNTIADDAMITSVEVKSFPFLVMRLQLIGSKGVIESFGHVYKEIQTVFDKTEEPQAEIDDEDHQKILKALSQFSAQCRDDLGLDAVMNDKDALTAANTVIEESLKSVQSKRDTTKYSFKGEELGKGPYVLAFIHAFTQKYPGLTLEQLQECFPKVVLGSYDIVVSRDDALKKMESSKSKRKLHFLNEDQIIYLSDGPAVVSNQWGKPSFDRFLDHVKDYEI